MTAFDRSWGLLKSDYPGYEQFFVDTIPPTWNMPYGGIVEHYSKTPQTFDPDNDDVPQERTYTEDHETEEPQQWFWNWAKRIIRENDSLGRPLGRVLLNDFEQGGPPGYHTGMGTNRRNIIETYQRGGFPWQNVKPNVGREKTHRTGHYQYYADYAHDKDGNRLERFTPEELARHGIEVQYRPISDAVKRLAEKGNYPLPQPRGYFISPISGKEISMDMVPQSYEYADYDPERGGLMGVIYGLMIDPNTLRPENQEFVNQYDKPYAAMFNQIWDEITGGNTGGSI